MARIERTNTGAGRFLQRDGGAGRFVRYGFKGQSDLTGFLKDGRVLAIEVKRPGKKATPEQQAYLNQIRESGGVAGLASSIKTAMAIIEDFYKSLFPIALP